MTGRGPARASVAAAILDVAPGQAKSEIGAQRLVERVGGVGLEPDGAHAATKAVRVLRNHRLGEREPARGCPQKGEIEAPPADSGLSHGAFASRRGSHRPTRARYAS